MIEENISKESILSFVSQEDIYEFYLGELCIGRVMSCPYRQDITPSFALFYHTNGILLYKDFANNEIGDCFKLVQRLFNLNYLQTLKKIQHDTISNSITNNKSRSYTYSSNNNRSFRREKGKSKITFIEKNWDKKDLDYWLQYGITLENLNYFNIKVLKEVYYDGKSWLRYSISNPIFLYQINDEYKFYRPLSPKGYKWAGNMKNSTLLGIDLIPNRYDQLVIITKGYKDCIVLHNLGYTAICFAGESNLLTLDYLYKILTKSSKLFYLGDDDDCGRRCLARMNEFGIPGHLIKERVNNRRADISDCYKYFGKDKCNEILNKIL